MFLLLASLLCLSIATTALYNAFLHPLHTYPGPTLSALTTLPRLWHIITGAEAHAALRLHRAHGPAIRLGPNELSFTSARAWTDIYGHAAAHPKDPHFYAPAPNGSPDILRSDAAAHARYRRAFAPAFSDRALRLQAPLLRTHVAKLVRRLRGAAGAPVDLAKLYNFATFDVMADLAFGEPLGLLDGSEYVPWVAAIFEYARAAAVMRGLKEYGALYRLVVWLLPAAVAERGRRHFAFSAERVARRLERGATKPDIWSQVLGRDAGLTEAEMCANANRFMAAGTETSATLLSALTYYLPRNPEKMERLKREIRGEFASDEEITVERLPRLRYLHACIEEGLRIHPPAAIGPVRVIGGAGAEVCGKWVPGGTKVSVPHLAAYRSPQNFSRPDDFIPERWLDHGGEFALDKRDVFQPFNYGPRNCIGRNLAYYEIRLIMASVLRNFDISLAPESENWADHKVWLIWAKPPLICKLQPLNM